MQDIHDRVDKLLNLNKYKAKFNKRKRGISKTIIAVLLIFTLVFNFIPVTFDDNSVVRGAVFGDTVASGSTWQLSDDNAYTEFTNNQGNGYVDNITVYYKNNVDSEVSQCNIYFASNNSQVANGQSDTVNVNAEGSYSWHVHSYSGSKPWVENNTNYLLCIGTTSANLGVGCVLSGGNSSWDKNGNTGGMVWADPIGADASLAYIADIYCSFTPTVGWSNTAPTISSPYPNATTGIKPYEICRLNITANDVNDANQSMNVTFRTNASGAWLDAQTNSSVGNGTYRCLNTSWITAENTKYYWSVNCSDGQGGNTNQTFSFTTGAEEPGYTSYYVAKNGNDSWDGRSPCNRTNDNGPWLTVDYALSQMSAGKRVYIREGEYDEAIFDYNDARSGNTTHPVIWMPYANEEVWIKEGNDTTNSGCFIIYAQHDYTFRDLGFKDGALFGFYLATDDATEPIHNITWTNCTFQNMTESAIRFAPGVAGIRDCLVENCYAEDICNSWATTAGQEGFSFSNCSYCEIRNTTIRLCAKNCIDFKSKTNNCIADNNTINTTHNSGHLTNGARRQLGGGIYIDSWSTFTHNNTISNNTIWGNKTGIQIGIELASGDYSENHTVINNVCNITDDDPDVSPYCLVLNYNEPSTTHRLRDMDFKQNTWYGSYGIKVEFYGLCMDDINFSNNIVNTTDNCFWRVCDNATFDMYNMMFNGSNIDYYGNNPVNGSPGFISAGTDFNLSSTSDAIDSGIDTGITIDIAGNTRPDNSIYDIGAYESMYNPWSNTAPVNSNEDPQDGNTTALTPTLRISVNDVNAGNQSMNTTWMSNSSGSWVCFGQNTSSSNTTFYQTFTNASAYETKYWWSVNTSDGYNAWDNDTFSLTTIPEPPDSDPGTNYYVSNSGLNTNNGTHISTPWQTVAKVNSELNGGVISSGDNIYFKRGDTFSDTGLVVRVGGTSANWMVIGAYGSGNLPIISGNDNNNNVRVESGGLNFINFSNLNLQNSGANAFQCVYTGTDNITLNNIDVDNSGTNGIRITYTDHYKLENCDVTNAGLGGILIYGNGDASGSRNGKIMNCTSTDAATDGFTYHVASTGIGPNHYMYNCTSTGSGENGFDITSGSNIYLLNCSASGNSISPFVCGHDVQDVVIDGFNSTNDPYGILATETDNLIVRNSEISFTNLYMVYIYGATATRWVYDTAIYNNNIIWDSGSGVMHFNHYTETHNLKNNIFYSTQNSAPGTFLNVLNGDLTDYDMYWDNNMWWRGDGLTGNHWSVDGSGYNWAGWTGLARVTGDLRDNPEFANPSNYNFDLNATSPCIDTGAWLTTTDGSGSSSTTVTVNEANYFFDGITNLPGADITGDNIFVGSNTDLVITDVNYATNVITVNRSISWSDEDYVSLSSYNGDKVDIGARESSYTIGWSNTAPVNSNPHPYNSNTSVVVTPQLRIVVNDVNMGNQSVNTTWYSNSSGSWVAFGQNTSGTNTTFYQTFDNATSYDTKYYWSVNTSDGYNAWDNDTYYFTTKGNTAPSFSNLTPTNNSVGISVLTAVLYITINDTDGDTFSYNWECSDGTSNSAVGNSNGTKNLMLGTSPLEYNTTYWWWVNSSDGTDYTNSTFYFTTQVNNSPVLSNEEPSNGSIDVVRYPRCNITANDPEGDSMNISFASNCSGAWVVYQNNNSVSNGTYKWDFTQAGANHTTYYWRVYANDSLENISETYHFTTLNNAPTISDLYPSNTSTNIPQLPTISLSANDLEGDTLTVYWYENSSGSYVLRQTNTTVTANSTVQWFFDEANGSNDKYWYSVKITDGIEWVNATYYLTTSIRIFDILFVDNFTKYSGNPILERTLGDWDNYGIRDIGILVNETGYLRKMNGTYQMLYNGRNYSGEISNTSIGRAYSTNLITNMTKYENNPIFVNTTSGIATRYSYAFQSSFLELSGGEYRIYYSSDSNSNLSLINSTNGIDWIDRGRVYDPSTNATNPDDIGTPDVKYLDGEYYCVYSGQHNGNSSIFMLNSTDGINWYPSNGGNPIYEGTQSWEYDTTKHEVSTPKIYRINNSMYVILYSGRSSTNYWDIGAIFSRTVDSGYVPWENNPILTNGSTGTWDDIRIHGPTIVMNDLGKHTLRMWYFGLPYTNSFREGAIGYATCDDPYYTEPWQENPIPGNESIDVSLNPQLQIDVYDNQGDTFNVAFWTNASGTWALIGTNNTGATNGTLVRNPTTMSSRSITYYWSANITDGSGFWENLTYHFTTLGGPAVTPPNITHENPVNGSTGVSFAPTCNVTVTHPDGENSTVYFYENSTSSFVLRQTVTNVLNESASFTFTNADEESTKYWWRVSSFDGSNYTNETYSFTTGGNDAPTMSSESPSNDATGVALNPTLSITIADNDSDLLYVTWRTNASGTWSDIEQDDDVLNSTQTATTSNMGNYSTKYWWSVNVSDFYGHWTNETYSFTTRSAPSSPSGGGAIGGGTGYVEEGEDGCSQATGSEGIEIEGNILLLIVFIIVIIIAIIVLLIWR